MEQTIFQFGDAKLAAVDLDPLYTALVRSGLEQLDLCRYTLAEVTFDLAGKAADVVEQAQDGSGHDFWGAMRDAAEDTARGAPRRYFRGAGCQAALERLQLLYYDAPEALRALAGPFADAADLMCDSWPLFGPTAAFKLCDMAERVCGIRVDFSAVGPKEICSNVQVQKGWDKARAVLGCDDGALHRALQSYTWATKASPRYDRELNAQEWETLLCYYSHDPATNKHLPGMDRLGIAEELWDHGALADRVLHHLPWATPEEEAQWRAKRKERR